MEEQIIEVAEKAVWSKAAAMVKFAAELIKIRPQDSTVILEALAEVMEAN